MYLYSRTYAYLLRIGQRCILRSVVPSKFLPVCQRNQGFSFARLAPVTDNSQTFDRNWLIQRRGCYTSASSGVKEQNISDPEVVVQGSNVPKPCLSFFEADLEEHILLELQRLGFKEPTTIQSHCLPVALGGRDLVGIGQTGSGKTLAYVLPALVHFSTQSALRTSNGPPVLILAPTRELAQQIQEVVQKFRDICGIKSTCVYGGVSKRPQIGHLERGVNICIATPGRLIDLLEMGAIRLSQVAYLVVDEADRLLDMGFEPQLREIVKQISSDHQTLMWSATWPPEVRSLAQDFLNNPVQVTVGSTELMANPNITQKIHMCTEYQKPEMFCDLVEKILTEKKNKVLVFTKTKRQADDLTRDLVWKKKFRAAAIHGDKSQLQRDKALNDFRSNIMPVLVATDVAARGLDITDITHVVNYDFPNNIETYVHRIGRTARAYRTGTAHSFFTPEDDICARDLVNVLKKCNQPVEPELEETVRLNSHRKSYRSSSYSPQGYNNNRNRDGFFNNNRNRDSFFNNNRGSNFQRSSFDRMNEGTGRQFRKGLTDNY